MKYMMPMTDNKTQTNSMANMPGMSMDMGQ
jgi:hypothetical protein